MSWKDKVAEMGGGTQTSVGIPNKQVAKKRMSGRGSKAKGANGEREAAKLLMEWLDPVAKSLGIETPDMKRNLTQTRGGGYDVEGLDWMALEIKRREQLNLPGWWRQTLRQAREGQIPVLMWRQNNRPWQFRARLRILHCGHVYQELAVDMTADQARLWLEREFWQRSQIGVESSDGSGYK